MHFHVGVVLDDVAALGTADAPATEGASCSYRQNKKKKSL
jgi:hypothetical protein